MDCGVVVGRGDWFVVLLYSGLWLAGEHAANVRRSRLHQNWDECSGCGLDVGCGGGRCVVEAWGAGRAGRQQQLITMDETYLHL